MEKDLFKKTIKLYCDGASKGNPGPSGAGAIAYIDNKVLFEISKDLGINTNNFAEYSALYLGLKEILSKIKNPEFYRLEIYLDSELIVKQLKGEYKIKSNNLKELHQKIKEILLQFPDFDIYHIPREQNKIADKLASKKIFET
ncbi:MAG: ribonuclease HI [Leptospiraceae bacterium]|nr:MAG: ribonuclease HI [Leptospiraceae bacterium]